jgi:hypothetical protein
MLMRLQSSDTLHDCHNYEIELFGAWADVAWFELERFMNFLDQTQTSKLEPCDWRFEFGSSSVYVMILRFGLEFFQTRAKLEPNRAKKRNPIFAIPIPIPIPIPIRFAVLYFVNVLCW